MWAPESIAAIVSGVAASRAILDDVRRCYRHRPDECLLIRLAEQVAFIPRRETRGLGSPGRAARACLPVRAPPMSSRADLRRSQPAASEDDRLGVSRRSTTGCVQIPVRGEKLDRIETDANDQVGLGESRRSSVPFVNSPAARRMVVGRFLYLGTWSGRGRRAPRRAVSARSPPRGYGTWLRPGEWSGSSARVGHRRARAPSRRDRFLLHRCQGALRFRLHGGWQPAGRSRLVERGGRGPEALAVRSRARGGRPLRVMVCERDARLGQRARSRAASTFWRWNRARSEES